MTGHRERHNLTAGDALRTMKKAQRLALKHGRNDLVEELTVLMEDVREADHVLRQERARSREDMRRVLNVATDVIRRTRQARHERRSNEWDLDRLQSELAEEWRYHRLWETGWHVEGVHGPKRKAA